MTGAVEIRNAAALAKIGHDSGYPLDGRYVLTRDIDLDDYKPWTPIGTSLADGSLKADTGREFSGAFDGRGFSIKNLHLNTGGAQYSGLFGYASMARIENFSVELAGEDEADTVELDIVTHDVYGKVYVGAVLGFGNYVTLKDIVVKSAAPDGIAASCEGATEFYFGGLAGQAAYSELLDLEIQAPLAISNTLATTKVYAGGIVGVSGEGVATSASGKASIVDSCRASGFTFTGSGAGSTTTENVLGGIVGFSRGGLIRRSFLNGDFTVTEPKGPAYAGGIVGVMSTGAFATAGGTVSDSGVTGDVTIGGAPTVSFLIKFGGIAGVGHVSGSVLDGTVTVDIAPTVAFTGEIDVGGIAGSGSVSGSHIADTGGVDVDIEYSGNGTGAMYIGGIAGVSTGGYVRDSYLSGTVSANINYAATAAATNTANLFIGGITGGSPSGAVTVSNCYLSGEVNVDIAYKSTVTAPPSVAQTSVATTAGIMPSIGGIVGRSGGAGGTINDSHFTGGLTVNYSHAFGIAQPSSFLLSVGGIIGSMQGAAPVSNIRRCYANGGNTVTVTNTVSGATTNTGLVSVGGIVGYLQPYTFINECWTGGTVTGVFTATQSNNPAATLNIGGIAGVMTSKTVNTQTVDPINGAINGAINCYSSAAISGTTTGSTNAALDTGGIAGWYGADSCSKRCYVSGAITNSSSGGGLAGGIASNEATAGAYTVQYCAVLSPSISLTGTGNKNGYRIARIGTNSATSWGNIAKSDMSVTGWTVNGDNKTAAKNEGADASPEVLGTAAFFSNTANEDGSALGWDFVNVWKWDGSKPVLQWQ
jgi:hypothetical protein